MQFNRARRLLKQTVFIGSIFFLNSFFNTAWAAQKEVEIVLDCSRSMLDSVEGGRKLDVAKTSIISVLNQIPPDAAVGFRVFSSTPVTGNVSESCKDSIRLLPIQTGGRQALITKVMSLEAHGATPIGYSLQEAARDFSPASDVQKTIILVSDGAETCGMDPVAVVQGLRSQGIEILIHAIGFNVDAGAMQQLKTLAEATGGTYYSAGSAIQLEQVVSEATQAVVTGFVGQAKAKPEETNLALPANGGTVVLASDPKLARLISGDIEGGHAYVPGGSEVVIHFKDKKVMELSKVALPIYETHENNLREFEILVSTESPTSGFSSVGIFETQNVAYIANPFQEFVFGPVRARYMKFIPRSFWNSGNWGYLFALRVFGKEATEESVGPGKTPDEPNAPALAPGMFTAKQTSVPQPAGPVNLALSNNGGKVVAGSREDMGILVDGKNDKYILTQPGHEVIIGFKDNQLAEITKVAVPIFKTQNDNLREFEVLVSPDSPTSGFVSVGTFEAQNIAFLENPFQEFVFDPVRGRYLKLIVKSGHGSGGWAQLYEIKVFGELITE